MTQTALRTVFPQLLLDKMVDAPSMQVVLVVKIPVVAQRLLHMVQPVLWTVKSPQLLLDMVIDVPVVQVVRVPQAPSW